jgi:hypothetical protein
MKCTIFANFLHPFKDCHVARFWVQCQNGTYGQFFPSTKLLVLPIKCRIDVGVKNFTTKNNSKKTCDV